MLFLALKRSDRMSELSHISETAFKLVEDPGASQ